LRAGRVRNDQGRRVIMDSRRITHSALGLAILFVLGLVGISSAADYPKVPILMVHGLGANSSGWNLMISRLKSKGYEGRLLYTIDMIDNDTLCSDSHIIQISNKVEEIVLKSGFSRIDVIGHSRGGLNLYEYMRFSNGAKRVRNWIALGSPISLSCSTIRNPPPDPTPGQQTLYTSIYSTSDELVNPSLATIEGARNIAVQNVSHFTMQLDTAIFTPVLEALRGTGLNDGAGVSSLLSAPTGVRVLWRAK
jgi:triacylglycerol lipase